MEEKELLNHSAAHVLAEAIMHLYPEAKLAIGPAIENGFYYDVDFPEPIDETALKDIEREMRRIAGRNEPFVREVVDRKKALELFRDNPYKLEIIGELPADAEITIYRQGGFLDLCRGPHVASTGKIAHFRLLSLAGAYWRGDSRNKMLTRIYGTCFPSEKELNEYLTLREEAKRRDHRKLGKELGLFMISDYGPGFPFWLPNGMIVLDELESYWKDLHRKNGYVFVKTPILLESSLWKQSGHYEHYKKNMFFSRIEGREFAIKPMNCPGGALVYQNSLHSYRDLPLRIAELGLVHRYEASGALNGLLRARAFTQDDAHVYCTMGQLEGEIESMLKLYDQVYSLFGLSYRLELSTRPEEGWIGEKGDWDESERILAEACRKTGREFAIRHGEGAFYGPKLDFKLKDSLGRIWQCGTIQLDMNLPVRFDLSYIDEKGEKKRPVMLHRAIYGSLERFVAVLIEHFAGAFPTWLAPEQVRVLPVNAEFHAEYARKVTDVLKDAGVRAKLDASDEKLGYRLRNAQLMKVPYTLVVGENEVKEGSVTYRRFGSRQQVSVPLKDFVELISNEIRTRALPQSVKA